MFKVGITRYASTAAWRHGPRMAVAAPLRSSGAPPWAARPVLSLSCTRWNSTSSDCSFVDPEKLVSQIAETHSDQLGYLSSVGLGDGWGPTSWICHLLEHVHVHSGLPWWLTIVLSTVAVRAVMFPLYVKSSANMAKMSRVKPQLDNCMQIVKDAELQQEKMAALAERKRIMKEHDIRTSHSFLPLLQVPIAYGFFQALRGMANVPVEGFATQGALWFENLAQVDPYLGLHVLTACVVTGMLRLGGETGAQAMNPLMKKVLTYLPFLSIFVTYNMSAAVLVYFSANAIFSIVQSAVLRNSYFRRWTGIPAIQPPIPVPGAKPPPTTISEWWTQFNNKAREDAEKKRMKIKVDKAAKRFRNQNTNFIKRH